MLADVSLSQLTLLCYLNSHIYLQVLITRSHAVGRCRETSVPNTNLGYLETENWIHLLKRRAVSGLPYCGWLVGSVLLAG